MAGPMPVSACPSTIIRRSRARSWGPLLGYVHPGADLIVGGLGGIGDARLAGEDLREHVLERVRTRLDGCPARILRGDEAAGRGGAGGDGEVGILGCGGRGEVLRVRDVAGRDHQLLILLTGEQLDPVDSEVLVLAPGGDAEVGATEEDGGRLARGAAG